LLRHGDPTEEHPCRKHCSASLRLYILPPVLGPRVRGRLPPS